MGYLNDFPAKTNEDGAWLPLPTHLADTAGVMRYLCRTWVPASVIAAAHMTRAEFTALAEFCAAVHDIGKATMVFLVDRLDIRRRFPELACRLEADGVILCRCGDAQLVPHNFASASICLTCFGVDESVCEVLGSHHGRPRGKDRNADFRKQLRWYPKHYYGSEENRAAFEAAWREGYDEAIAFSDILEVGGFREISVQAQMLLTGLLIVADWIASNENYFPLIGDAPYPKDRLQKGWEAVKLPGFWESQYTQIEAEDFQERFGFYPRPAQAEVIRVTEDAEAAGLMLVECQMGAGKTEAALAAAEVLAARHGAGGIFFGLPTKGTANGIFPRIRQWADSVSAGGDATSLRLAHGDAAFNELFEQLQNQISDEDAAIHGGVTVNQWLLGNRRQLLSDFVIGTVDQALMAALRTKFIMLRHLGLAGKIVIIDEVHAYDAYMSEYLEYLLRWLGSYGVPVILLSATLSSDKKTELVNAYLNSPARKPVKVPGRDLYPSLTWTDGQEVHAMPLTPVAEQAMCVSMERMKTEDIASVIAGRLNGDGCAEVVLNTVRAARETAQRLREALPGYKVVLIHSCFLPEDRRELESEVTGLCGRDSGMAERRGVIVVGTQVLEQSLDVDFDLLFTQWCPVDLLFQRIGRLHRHRRHDAMRPAGAREPVCFLCEDEYFPLYDAYLLRRTREELVERDALTLPGDIRGLVDAVYDLTCGADGQDKKGYKVKSDDSQNKADVWRMPNPSWAELRGLLDWSIPDGGDTALQEAAVRDISDGMQILLLVRDGYDIMTVNGRVRSAADVIPAWGEAKAFLQQRLTLPRFLTDRTAVDSIRRRMNECIPEWLNSQWFEHELILLLDTAGQAVLETNKGQYVITYSRSEGLDWRKGE